MTRSVFIGFHGRVTPSHAPCTQLTFPTPSLSPPLPVIPATHLPVSSSIEPTGQDILPSSGYELATRFQKRPIKLHVLSQYSIVQLFMAVPEEQPHS